MTALLRPGSVEARALYQLMAGERLIELGGPPEGFIATSAAVVYRLMQIKPTPLAVWLCNPGGTTDLADQLNREFVTLGDQPRLRVHDQASWGVRHVVGDPDSPDHIPMTESVALPQQAQIAHLLALDVDTIDLGSLHAELPTRTQQQILIGGRLTWPAKRILLSKLVPPYTPIAEPRWGPIPFEVIMAGGPS